MEEAIALVRGLSPPDDLLLAESLVGVAEVYWRMSGPGGALGSLTEAHALYARRLGPLNPFSGNLLRTIANALQLGGDTRAALLAMERSEALSPPATLPSAQLCTTIYRAAGDLRGARRCAELQVRIARSDPVALDNLAWELLDAPGAARVDVSRAEDLARFAHLAEPRSPAIADTLAVARMRLGRAREAVDLLEEAIEAARSKSPQEDLPHLHLHAAQGYADLGDYARAAAHLEEARRIPATPSIDGDLDELFSRLVAYLPEDSGTLSDD